MLVLQDYPVKFLFGPTKLARRFHEPFVHIRYRSYELIFLLFFFISFNYTSRFLLVKQFLTFDHIRYAHVISSFISFFI